MAKPRKVYSDARKLTLQTRFSKKFPGEFFALFNSTGKLAGHNTSPQALCKEMDRKYPGRRIDAFPPKGVRTAIIPSRGIFLVF